MTSSRAVFCPQNKIAETLSSPAMPGKRALDPFRAFAKETGLPMNLLEDCQVNNDAEVHQHEADLWLCLEGEVTFVCDGELVESWPGKRADGTDDLRELKAKEIRGGTTYTLKSGDWLWIPAGVPHQHRATGTARLIIIKIPVGADE